MAEFKLSASTTQSTAVLQTEPVTIVLDDKVSDTAVPESAKEKTDDITESLKKDGDPAADGKPEPETVVSMDVTMETEISQTDRKDAADSKEAVDSKDVADSKEVVVGEKDNLTDDDKVAASPKGVVDESLVDANNVECQKNVSPLGETESSTSVSDDMKQEASADVVEDSEPKKMDVEVSGADGEKELQTEVSDTFTTESPVKEETKEQDNPIEKQDNPVEEDISFPKVTQDNDNKVETSEKLEKDDSLDSALNKSSAIEKMDVDAKPSGEEEISVVVSAVPVADKPAAEDKSVEDEATEISAKTASVAEETKSVDIGTVGDVEKTSSEEVLPETVKDTEAEVSFKDVKPMDTETTGDAVTPVVVGVAAETEIPTEPTLEKPTEPTLEKTTEPAAVKGMLLYTSQFVYIFLTRIC